MIRAEVEAGARAFLQAAQECGLTPSRQFAEHAARAVLASCGTPVETPGVELTPARLQALRLAAGGLTNEQIAAKARIDVETVKSTLASTYRKLGAANRAHAVALGMVHGLILPGDVLPSLERAA